ncbi:MAG: CinA family protein [Winkia neuii]|nr:CinA family protein [Winkia neuii]
MTEASTNHTLAAQLIQGCKDMGYSIAVAESLTGGWLASSIVDIPGASTVFRGGALTYQTQTKASVLGVSVEELEQTGPYTDSVARQMAEGVLKLYSADMAIATSGVAGPGDDGGHPAGEVHICVLTPTKQILRTVNIEGDRATVRAQSVILALAAANTALED